MASTVAILAEDLFEDIELLYPYYRLLEEGARVVVVGSGGAKAHGKHGIAAEVDVQASELTPPRWMPLSCPVAMPSTVCAVTKTCWISFALSMIRASSSPASAMPPGTHLGRNRPGQAHDQRQLCP